VEHYDRDTLPNRAFAFDGTIVAVEVREDPRLPHDGSPDGRERLWVTFDIKEWYRGWGGDSASVWFDVSNPEGVEVGTHALVSGEARWGGEPDEDPIAWPCGFTRYWDQVTATQWAAAFSSTTEPTFGGEPIEIADCAHTNFAVLLRGEVNTAYDADSRVLQLSARGRDGTDTVFFVKVDDPTCRSDPALTEQIRDAIHTASETGS
jgi:hypothetical protein